MEEQGQSNQVTEMAKQKAEQIAKQTAQKAAKEVGKAALRVAKKAIMAAAKAAMQAIMAALPYILIGVAIVLVVIILIAGIKMLLDKETTASAAEAVQSIQQDFSKYITIDNKEFVINDALYDKYFEVLDTKGMNGGEFLYRDSKYLKAIFKAELASTYPKLNNTETTLDSNTFQGTVEIIRRSPDAEDDDRYTEDNKKGDNEILLTYKPYKQFNDELKALESGYQEGKYEELRRYFTIKEEQTTEEESTEETENTQNTSKTSQGIIIIIPTFDGTSVSSQEISYQNNINKYSVPVEFLISQLEVTQNPEYIYSLADMVVNNSKIELVIQETKTTTTTKTVTNTYKTDEDGNKETDENGNYIIQKGKPQETTQVSYGIMKYIRQVDTWIVNVLQEYTKNVTTTTTGGLVYDQVGTFTETTVKKIEFIGTPGVSNNSTTTPAPSTTLASDATKGVAQAIPESIKQSMQGKSMKDNNNIGYDDLMYLQIPYKDFSGNRQVGEMIVAKNLAEEVLCIFEELYNIGYPIEKMTLVDNYYAGTRTDGSSDLKSDWYSIEDNNTSAFNYRLVSTGTGAVSKHGLGRAIDINPLINVCISDATTNPYTSHPESKKFLNRNDLSGYSDIEKKAFIGPNTEIYEIFKKYGWTWGGESFGADYLDTQHFEKP